MANFPKLPAFTPAFPTMPPITFLTPEDIAKKTGSNYNGVAVSSISSSSVDKNGNVVKKGGGYILTNNNGVVEKISCKINFFTIFL